ncbi:zinc-containing alcohol dehydrogenase [Rhodococcus opacus PD630]|uniref:zinc-binding dehydrogenase n=1 Tax=Rhodococcus TaxID=1827 RepID=UPI00029CD1A9|nr:MULTISPECIES: zinc-binding dehydrogenase [Rhodococcus]KXF56497.1 acryloyl-CoA reductase [Rhodococcus sp. SC4]NDV09934.1 zinc-binding dehydrogenase [Rhodococcus sp. IEGM 248]RZK72058.1 MAG: acryloyl-CoA reductase [Rhodococcus sp. (in: high G+C Gram-positive bacteria)]AHK32012.1 Quinone oxidoreductase PIG3 [Rhodococcus opacus PD630]EHI45287.1 zinc-containing alcohol dehydrogenase [Rhodococcus opacus PD630]
MRAARAVPHPDGGKVTVLDVPTPTPGPDQVLVKVKAAGLNRGEILQAGRVRTGEPQPIGVEFAGEVAAVGAGVTQWREGDRVMGHGNGGQAEYALAASRALMRVPDSVSWADAAAFPNVFITAHDALITNGQLRTGETVLVNAASSGIGLASIEIARAMGASRIVATSRSADKVERLKTSGVDCAIDVSTTDQVDAVAGFTTGNGVDIIVDSVGGTTFEANLESLAVQGRLVNIGRLGSSTATIDLNVLWLKRLKLIGVTFRTRTEEERLACVQACARDLLVPLEAGTIRTTVDRTYRLDEIAAAHAYMQTDQHFGKIVLLVDDALADAS